MKKKIRKNYKYSFQSDLRNKFIFRINKFFKDMKTEQWNFKQFLKIKNEKIYEHEDWVKLTNNYNYYLQGYFDALYNQLWAKFFEWKMFHPKLGLVDDKDVSDYSELIPEGGVYVWKGTTKIYYKMCSLFWEHLKDGDLIYRLNSDGLYGPYKVIDKDMHMICDINTDFYSFPNDLTHFYKPKTDLKIENSNNI